MKAEGDRKWTKPCNAIPCLKADLSNSLTQGFSELWSLLLHFSKRNTPEAHFLHRLVGALCLPSLSSPSSVPTQEMFTVSSRDWC